MELVERAHDQHGYLVPDPVREMDFDPLLLRTGGAGFEKALRIGHGLAADGLALRNGMPRNPLHAALLGEMGEGRLPGAYAALEQSCGCCPGSPAGAASTANSSAAMSDRTSRAHWTDIWPRQRVKRLHDPADEMPDAGLRTDIRRSRVRTRAGASRVRPGATPFDDVRSVGPAGDSFWAMAQIRIAISR
jgi:hypothetical protein